MDPNSPFLVVVLGLSAVALLVVIMRYRKLAVRIVASVLTLALAALGGMAVVNDYYGYYSTWGQLGQDLSGSYSTFSTASLASRTSADPLVGRVELIDLPGALSKINREGFVYLPPQYFEPRYAHTRFPVVELLHGSPGDPLQWINHMGTPSIMNQLLTEHLLGPMVLVVPATYSGRRFTECLNVPRALDETYLVRDVRTDLISRFRVSADPAQWGMIGMSSGGYCAANIALQHRGAFGAAGIMSGYFRPQDGPAAAVLHHNPAAEAANDPLLLARKLTPDTSPLPAFWLSAGTAVPSDIAGARAFARALHGVEQVEVLAEHGGEHTISTFRPAFIRMLPWMWQQLAPPDLRVRFPVAGGVTNGSVHVSHAKQAVLSRREEQLWRDHIFSGAGCVHRGAHWICPVR